MMKHVPNPQIPPLSSSVTNNRTEVNGSDLVADRKKSSKDVLMLSHKKRVFGKDLEAQT